MLPLPFLLEKVANRFREIYKEQGPDGVALILLSIFVICLAIAQMVEDMM